MNEEQSLYSIIQELNMDEKERYIFLFLIAMGKIDKESGEYQSFCKIINPKTVEKLEKGFEKLIGFGLAWQK